MKQRLLYLGIYTLVVLVLSFLLQGFAWFETVLYAAIIIIGIGVVGSLNPFLTNSRRNEKRTYDDISYVSILTYLYLFVPLFLSIYLFVG